MKHRNRKARLGKREKAEGKVMLMEGREEVAT
jgi:hypothetical protein